MASSGLKFWTSDLVACRVFELAVFLLLATWWASTATARTAFATKPFFRKQAPAPTFLPRHYSAEQYFGPRVRGKHLQLSRRYLQAFGENSEQETDPVQDQDWRDFRARLVQQTRGQKASSDTKPGNGWAYQTDLLEQGSLLVSVPGDYWSIRRQYFCKAVFLVIKHTSEFTAAVVLNRPTGLTTRDISDRADRADFEKRIKNDILGLVGMGANADEWKVWFGGDGEGLESWGAGVRPSYICLHTLSRFSECSRQVIRGIFLIEFDKARELVRNGQATQDDFMLIAGYTGWGPGQLQSELDRGGAWILGAADQGLLLGTGEEKLSLNARLQKACAMRLPDGSITPESQNQFGDGIHHWNKIYSTLRPTELNELDPEEELHNDEMIRRWIKAYLVKPIAVGRQQTPASEDRVIPAGTILRGSATHWILGRPDASWPSRTKVDPWQLPGQYMHKAVLMLRNDCTSDQAPRLVLLNGPKISSTITGGDVRFGGVEACNAQNVLATTTSDMFAGSFSLPAGTLQELLKTGALHVARVFLDDVCSVEPNARWQAAGGTLETLTEVSAAAQGDRQQRKWYRAMLGI